MPMVTSLAAPRAETLPSWIPSRSTKNVSRKDGAPYLHLHITIGDPVTGQVHAGHLSSAVISATLELFLQVWDGQVGRRFSEDVGLNLFDFT